MERVKNHSWLVIFGVAEFLNWFLSEVHRNEILGGSSQLVRWLGSPPIYKPVLPFIREPTLFRGLTNHGSTKHGYLTICLYLDCLAYVSISAFFGQRKIQVGFMVFCCPPIG